MFYKITKHERQNMYFKIGNLASISGHNGAYDNFISNNDARFGRNATDNYKKYIQSYYVPRTELSFSPQDSLDQKIEKTNKFIEQTAKQQAQLPPINFRFNYMPVAQRGLVNQQALLGAAYEELGERLSVSVQEMDSVLNYFGDANKITSDALDINRDGNIDISEYSTSILLADMLDEGSININNIDGTITNKGENALTTFGLEQNKEIAYRIYSSLHQGYGLSGASREFVSNQNNTIHIY